MKTGTKTWWVPRRAPLRACLSTCSPTPLPVSRWKSTMFNETIGQTWWNDKHHRNLFYWPAGAFGSRPLRPHPQGKWQAAAFVSPDQVFRLTFDEIDTRRIFLETNCLWSWRQQIPTHLILVSLPSASGSVQVAFIPTHLRISNHLKSHFGHISEIWNLWFDDCSPGHCGRISHGFPRGWHAPGWSRNQGGWERAVRRKTKQEWNIFLLILHNLYRAFTNSIMMRNRRKKICQKPDVPNIGIVDKRVKGKSSSVEEVHILNPSLPMVQLGSVWTHGDLDTWNNSIRLI